MMQNVKECEINFSSSGRANCGGHPRMPKDISEKYLRQRQLSGFRFRRQVPIAGYIADFACIEAKLVVELDGGQHQAQHHYDTHRDEVIRCVGIRVLRFWNNDVLQQTDAVLQVIVAALKQPPP